MRVVLPIPRGWQAVAVRAGWAYRPEHGNDDDPILVTSALLPLPPLSFDAWIERRLRDDLPSGCELRIEHTARSQSDHGWPVTTVRCVVVNARAAIVEHRVVTVYRFIQHGTTVELRARRPLALDDGDRELAQLLLQGKPDFTGEVACLADLLGR
jgi:hypothetical protein